MAFIASALPTTQAIASPRNRTWLTAKTGWSMKPGITPKALRPGTSLAVNTAETAGWVACHC